MTYDDNHDDDESLWMVIKEYVIVFACFSIASSAAIAITISLSNRF
jgi:hypothetical protein